LTGRLGTQLFGENITIADDVYHPLQSGAPFDGEGMCRKTVPLVERGVVQNVVYSRQTAKLMQAEPTGHGFPLPNEFGEAPMNIVIAGGGASVDKMIAGTERGMGSEPKATFSACFGAPFLVLHPTVYADMLGERIAKHQVQCWLVNTGWSGGPFGVGERIKLPVTRAMLRSALDGELARVPRVPDPVFGLEVPTQCPGVTATILNPRSTWSDPAAYDARAAELAGRFHKNFQQFEKVPAAVRAAGPHLV
jgi:hypothetical protein